ncbi:hypothetical protein BDR07DRAFT_1378781 [Suillus spraguei]|nr:hypothetical protein BDR07DRAFT_1378781 [Suillus spraguei]
MSGKYNKRPAEEDLLASNTSKRSRIASGEGYRKGSDVCQDEDFRSISPDSTISWQDPHELWETVNRLKAEVKKLLKDRKRMLLEHQKEVTGHEFRLASLEYAALCERERSDDLQSDVQHQKVKFNKQQKCIKRLQARKERDGKDIHRLMDVVREKDTTINDLSDRLVEFVHITAIPS